MFEADVVTLYQAAVTEGRIQQDPKQLIMAHELNDLRTRLIDRTMKLKWPFGLFTRTAKEPEQGLYIWGGVGTGKTLLMDTFMESLPFRHKLRMHFYGFMKRVHEDLKLQIGHTDPLSLIAREWSMHTQVLCLDEFLVHDIADAMLIGELLRHLFQNGVVLVATSNVQPDNLYKDGLQRSRFLPAIACLKANTKTINLESAMDYRLRSLKQAELYHHPLDSDSDSQLKESWERLVTGRFDEGEWIEVNGRLIQSRASCEDLAWFDFQQLCQGPRSQIDYITIGKRFNTIILSNIPQLGAEQDDDARRFISLVDEFYDRRVKLIISAEVPIEAVYQGTKLSFEFERTQSRLIEMQSHEYLAMAHS